MPVLLFSVALHFGLVYSDRCLNCVWQSCSESERSISVRVRVRLKGAVSTNSNWFLKGFAGRGMNFYYLAEEVDDVL